MDESHELLTKRINGMSRRMWEAAADLRTVPAGRRGRSPWLTVLQESCLSGLWVAHPDDRVLIGADCVHEPEVPSGYTWSLQADGHLEYRTGGWTWVLSAALLTEDELVAGWVHFPAINDAYFASSDRSGVSRNGGPLKRVDGPTGNIAWYAAVPNQPSTVFALARVIEAGAPPRDWVVAHAAPNPCDVACRMLRGGLDALVVDATSRGLIAPWVVLWERAGLTVTDAAGSSLRFARGSRIPGVIVSADRQLHAELVSGFRAARTRIAALIAR